MNDNFVRLIANAGVLVCKGGKKILVDPLHRKCTRFSGVKESLIQDIIEGKGIFSHIDCLAITHEHLDHYEPDLIADFIKNHPETAVILPVETDLDNVYTLNEDAHEFNIGEIHIECKKITHEGEEYADDINYGFLIEIQGENLLFLGDSAVLAPQTKEWLQSKQIDTAFLNFPYVTLVGGKNTVKNSIRPKKIVVFHLPFLEDDTENYRKVTQYIVKKDKETMPPCHILFEENQEISI